jgi:hypothetical protein
MSFPDKDWQNITGIRAWKCRGGPLHGKWHEAQGLATSFRVDRQTMPAEYYYLEKNYETNKWEWIWGPILKKKQQKWNKKRQIEKICQEIEEIGWANPDIRQKVLSIMPLVIKL